MSIQPASTSQDGYLSDTDWNTFNDKQDVLSPARNLYVGGYLYPTIQSAVDAAQALAPATDMSGTEIVGITVHIPAGKWAEDVVVKGNINLRGLGQESTEIQSLTYRPASSTVGPMACRVYDLAVSGTLTVTNETAASSGVYFTTMGSIAFFRCIFGAADISNVGTIGFNSCTTYGGDQMTMTNVSSVILRGSYISWIDLVGDASLPGLLDALVADPYVSISLVNSWLILSSLTQSNGATVALAARHSQIEDLTLNDSTQLSTYASSVITLTKNGAGHSVSTVAAINYLPTTPGDWTTSPTTLDAALDELAARPSGSSGGVRTVTATGTLLSSDEVVLVDSASTTTQTLPAASAMTGKKLWIKRLGAGQVNINAAGTDTIDGSASASLTLQYQALILISDGTKWSVF